MARGRPNVNKAPAKKSAPAMASKPTAKQKATGGKAGGVLKSLASAGSSVLGIGGVKSSKRGRGMGGKHKLSAKQKLKRAYERRAIRQIHQGQLGQARRTLRKKSTVV